MKTSTYGWIICCAFTKEHKYQSVMGEDKNKVLGILVIKGYGGVWALAKCGQLHNHGITITNDDVSFWAQRGI